MTILYQNGIQVSISLYEVWVFFYLKCDEQLFFGTRYKNKNTTMPLSYQDDVSTKYCTWNIGKIRMSIYFKQSTNTKNYPLPKKQTSKQQTTKLSSKTRASVSEIAAAERQLGMVFASATYISRTAQSNIRGKAARITSWCPSIHKSARTCGKTTRHRNRNSGIFAVEIWDAWPFSKEPSVGNIYLYSSIYTCRCWQLRRNGDIVSDAKKRLSSEWAPPGLQKMQGPTPSYCLSLRGRPTPEKARGQK